MKRTFWHFNKKSIQSNGGQNSFKPSKDVVATIEGSGYANTSEGWGL